MILSDLSVFELLDKGKIKILPPPLPEHWQSMALDGHLSDQIFRIKWKEPGGGRITIDLADYTTSEFAKQFWVPVEPTNEGAYPIHPGDFLLAYTQEKLSLPRESKICALVEGKSGYARIGLGIHLAPIIHCGFADKEPQPIMLEMYNHSKNIILLRPGKPICQFMFQEVSGTISSPGSKSLGNNQPLPMKKISA